MHADAHSARLRFEVSDTGIGMAPQTSKLFPPPPIPTACRLIPVSRRFVALVGLAISKRVELMGHIGVESRQGEGNATFCSSCHAGLHGPSRPRAAPTRAAEAAWRPRLVGGHYLIVDDNALNLRYCCRHVALEIEGARHPRQAMAGGAGVPAQQPRSVRCGALMDAKCARRPERHARAIRSELGLTNCR